MYQTTRRHVQKCINVHSHRREEGKSYGSSIYQVENTLMLITAQFVPALKFKLGAITVGAVVEVQRRTVLVLTLV